MHLPDEFDGLDEVLEPKPNAKAAFDELKEAWCDKCIGNCERCGITAIGNAISDNKNLHAMYQMEHEKNQHLTQKNLAMSNKLSKLKSIILKEGVDNPSLAIDKATVLLLEE